MNKVKIISDINIKSQRIKSNLIKILKRNNIKNSEIIIVIGGDGFMLQTLKKIKNQKNFFMGSIQEIMDF